MRGRNETPHTEPNPVVLPRHPTGAKRLAALRGVSKHPFIAPEDIRLARLASDQNAESCSGMNLLRTRLGADDREPGSSTRGNVSGSGQDVRKFLEDINLGCYADKVLTSGFDCMETFSDVTENHLDVLGVALGHKVKVSPPTLLALNGCCA